MKALILALAVVLWSAPVYAQSFGGTVDLTYTNQAGTEKRVYLIKNKLVRLDEYSYDGSKVEQSHLFDLATGEVKHLYLKQKLWRLQTSTTPQVIKGQCVVTNSGKMKSIAGVKCVEYTVKNTEENTVITYYIATDFAEFFMPLAKLRNAKDRPSIYLTQIKDLKPGSMPFLIEERQVSDGKLLTKLEVTRVTKMAPENSTFEVPYGYKKVDH